ncbi:cytochrome P450 [Aquitalea sp. LB_tupeE]|uniref:cytochrome P450 n=1 Tax=Aquitalea sp. LB_tupeE TaxID=2748078 RepID=UPI0015B955B0|nr:cytochrome P450 [Aquitalea sp. LB_tupeE]NWK78902.1 cytochrome P450 [Aquitalea sp. LB_tupeE]
MNIIDIHQPSIIAALKLGLVQPQKYYEALREFGGVASVFYDHYIDGHVVVGYHVCQDIYRRTFDFGRGRFSLPQELVLVSKKAESGYNLMREMSIFHDATGTYKLRRQRLLGIVGHAQHTYFENLIQAIASEFITSIPSDSPVDIFATSLRPYTVQCANMAVLGIDIVPDEVTADALAVAFFFDGKRPQRHHVIAALEAVDRLGDWIATQKNISRDQDLEVLADLVLLYVAAHESLAYLLYTCLVQLSSKDSVSYPCTLERLSLLITEAVRFDSPIQMSGRIANNDVTLGNYVIRKGEKVYLHLGAANHDERVYDNPYQFIEGREQVHLGFGWGPTRCVGSAYASACALEYLTAIVSRFTGRTFFLEGCKFDHGLSARGLNSAIFSFGE